MARPAPTAGVFLMPTIRLTASEIYARSVPLGSGVVLKEFQQRAL